jgi:hypothetical protein
MKLSIGTRVLHPTYGEGVVCSIRFSHINISFVGKGMTEIDKNFSGLEVIEYAEEEGKVAVEDVKEILEDFLEKLNVPRDVKGLGERWRKGTMQLKPFGEDLAAKEIPIESFFHKIVMVRDKLRVLEQKINAHPKLEESEKVEMQQHITRCYGSLTTFNVLFKYKEDQFIGQKGE